MKKVTPTYKWSGDSYYREREYYNEETGLVVGYIKDSVISSKATAFVNYPQDNWVESKNLGTYMTGEHARKAVEAWVEKHGEGNPNESTIGFTKSGGLV